MIVRMRALSFATIGYTIGSANTPRSNSRWLSFLAIVGSPHITGVIGVSLRPMSKPIETSSFLKYPVFSHSRSTCCGSVSRTSIAAMHDAVVDGGGGPLGRHVRDLFSAE